MTARICSKCRFWKRSGGQVGAGMCIRFLQPSGAADTCAEWEVKKINQGEDND